MFCSEQGTYQWCDWIEYENNWPINGKCTEQAVSFEVGSHLALCTWKKAA